MAPLRCTQTPLFHVDYGMPLILAKSTDYRTTTGKSHQLMPSIPQYFDCRVKARIKPELLEKDIAMRNEFKSTYTNDYIEKHNTENPLPNDQAINSKRVDYIRNAQEKIFMNPPPLKPPKLSEMKESYAFHYWIPTRDPELFNFKCEIPETYRSLQPDINPAEKGFQKLLDIYLTENRSKYVPYTPDQLAKAQQDFITIYNASGQHKGLKEELPGRLHGYTNMYDKRVFRVEYPIRILSRAPKRVPNMGMTTEYRANLTNPTSSDFYPYLRENGIYFPESLSGSGPWQDLCPPGMYCTEYCHVGTGWPVRSVVDVNAPNADKEIVHSQSCCTRI